MEKTTIERNMLVAIDVYSKDGYTFTVIPHMEGLSIEWEFRNNRGSFQAPHGAHVEKLINDFMKDNYKKIQAKAAFF